jgi:excisionase family DNA binding protein
VNARRRRLTERPPALWETHPEPSSHRPTGGVVPAPDQLNLHSIAAIAKRLDVSEKSVRRYVERGRLPAYKIGGQIRIAEEDVRAFLSSCRLSKGDV